MYDSLKTNEVSDTTGKVNMELTRLTVGFRTKESELQTRRIM
jgi:hypothetical protein